MFYCKKIAKLLLIGLLTILLIVPTALASEQVSLLFNGHEYQADLYVENGVSYISAASLAKLPGLEVEQDGYVALRNFFENIGGKVGWDSDNSQITVSWQEKQGEWTADDLIMESTKKMQELNSYKMKGQASMKMAIDAPGSEEIPEIPEITVNQEAEFQQDPLTMYMLQTVKLPIEDMGLTEEELKEFDQGDMVTEMVMKENAIYQKMPPFDQWIVQDFTDLGINDDTFTDLLQTTPQQSLEMMRNFGMINVFGGDAVIDGKEYYVVKTYINDESFKKMTDELLGEFDLANLIGTQELSELDEELDEEEMAKIMEETQKIIEQMLANMEITYYIDNYINKDTLLTDYMKIDLDMNFGLDENIAPEGAINFDMKMLGEYELFDFGTEIQLPDVSNAITQQEFLEQMEEMPEETTEQM